VQELEMSGSVVIEPLRFPDHTRGMPTERFQASRWTKGTFLFRTIVGSSPVR
jgi:hypothetical protein